MNYILKQKKIKHNTNKNINLRRVPLVEQEPLTFPEY